MKKMIGLLGIVALGTAGSVYASEAVDFHVVNPVLQGIVDGLVSGDEYIDFAYPRFDETASSLSGEKLKYDLQGAMKDAPWLDGGKADVLASSGYVSDRTEGHTGINVAMSSQVRKADVMAMIRYAAYIALKKNNNGAPQFRPRIEAHLKRLAVAQSLEQVRDLLISGQKLAKEMTELEISKDTEYLHCLESGNCQNSGPDGQKMIEKQKLRVASWKTSLSAYDHIVFDSKAEQGKMTQLTLSSPQISQFLIYGYGNTLVFPEKGQITFTADSISANANAYYKMSLEGLNQLKADLQKDLVGAQNGNLAEKEDVQKYFREALKRFKAAIRGEHTLR
jgi:hypothetical protein